MTGIATGVWPYLAKTAKPVTPLERGIFSDTKWDDVWKLFQIYMPVGVVCTQCNTTYV